MQTQVITLCGTLTCVGTAAEWSSSDNGSSLLIDDRLDALPPPPIPWCYKTCCSITITDWLDTLTATGPTPSNTKIDY